MHQDYISYIRKKIGHDELLSVGLSCLVIDENGRVLLEKRSDNSLYCFPGGSIDLYETVTEGIIREVYEETHITLKNPKLFAVYSGEKAVFRYPNGDVTYYVEMTFIDYVNSKDLEIRSDSESTDISFYAIDEIPEDKYLLRGVREMLDKYIKGDMEVSVN